MLDILTSRECVNAGRDGLDSGVAVVAELADAPDLGSGRRLCGFKSHQPHAV